VGEESAVSKEAAALAEAQGARAASEEASAVAKEEQVEMVETVEMTAACSRGQMPHMSRTPQRTSLQTNRPRLDPAAA
jgi:hypothetical protein